MARYRVTLFYKETVEVEADSEIGAQEQAIDKAYEHVEWDEALVEEITFPEPFELNNTV